MSFYAVKKGFKPGIYTTWDECKKQTNGYSNAIFKKFNTKQEAEDFIKQKTPNITKKKKKVNKTSSKKKKKTTNNSSNFQPATIYKPKNKNITNSKNKTVVITPSIQPTKVISKKNNSKPTTNYSTNSLNLPKIYAFVNGSFNEKTRTYGYGGFVVINGEKHILQGKGNDIEMAKMQNVAGEILGSMAAMQFAIDNRLNNITILYDFSGVENWTNGEWETKLNYTKAYKQFFDLTKNYVNIKFQKVKVHHNIDGNEEADKLAKQVVGLR